MPNAADDMRSHQIDYTRARQSGPLMQAGQVTATTDFNEVAAEGAVYDRIA